MFAISFKSSRGKYLVFINDRIYWISSFVKSFELMAANVKQLSE